MSTLENKVLSNLENNEYSCAAIKIARETTNSQ